MRNQTFHFEIKDVLTQFIAAFDDIVIKRYDKDRNPINDLQVRYVYAPKQRVIYDIVNKAQNITLPVVSVSIASISRDESRVFNKIGGYYYSRGTSDSSASPTTINYRSPVPVNIDISMSIMTKYQSDLDQIISNFIPYNNPYIIISWKVPEDLVQGGFSYPQEIRSEVLWNGSINLSYPTDINATEKYKVSGDTSFTIKGWLFPAKQQDVKTIFYIDNNFYDTNILTEYSSLSATSFTYPLSTGLVQDEETVTVLGYPRQTNTNLQV